MRAKLAGVCLFAVALALGTGVPAQQAATTAITDIRQESSDRSTRLVVECTGPLAYTYYSPDPLTLVVDIPEVDASQVPARVNVGTREVESVRVTSLASADGRNLARVEVRLASLVPYQIFSKDKSLNLIFERPTSLAGAPAAAPAAPPPGFPGGRSAAAEPVVAAPSRPRSRRPPAPTPASRQPAAAAEPRPRRSCRAVRRRRASPPSRATRWGAAGVHRQGRRPPEVQGLPAAEPRAARGRLRRRERSRADALARGGRDARAPGAARPVQRADAEGRAPRRRPLAKSPYRIIDGADGVSIVFGESAEPAAHAPLAAMRARSPRPPRRPRCSRYRRPDSTRRPRPSRSSRWRCRRCPSRRRPRRPRPTRPSRGRPSRATSARPAAGRATSARRSASTSRTATCRTSSGSSRTSPG